MRPLPKEREGAATTPRQLSLKAPASTSEADADWRSIWWWVGGGGGGLVSLICPCRHTLSPTLSLSHTLAQTLAVAEEQAWM